MTGVMLMLSAMLVEIAIGWPGWLYRRIRHPVVWMGSLIEVLARTFNQPRYSRIARRLFGVLSTAFLVGLTATSTLLVAQWLPDQGWGLITETLIASSLLATRSLYVHVAAVHTALTTLDLASAQRSVAHIVGRDSSQLDTAGICRASIESLAENASDGVVAPLFWGAIFGLPGIAVYKAINTLDSMLGHRTQRFEAFGWASAKLDDIFNWVPARLTALAFVVVGMRIRTIKVVLSDARLHRSPNAGWPESALAGALDVRLSGPREYGGQLDNEPWVNGGYPDPDATILNRALRVYVAAMTLIAIALATLWVMRSTL